MTGSDKTSSATRNQVGVHCSDLLDKCSEYKWIIENNNFITQQKYSQDVFNFLNPLRGCQIQVISQNELEWVYGRTQKELNESPAFKNDNVKLVILSEQCRSNLVLEKVCEENQIGLVKVFESAEKIAERLQQNLPLMLVSRKTEHGVFLAVKNTGVLITGISGVGKSEVALDLIQRGHQLIADDAVSFYRTQNGDLVGECPEILRGYLEIRGLGVINVVKMFGPSAVLDKYNLSLMIKLVDATEREIQGVDRLRPSLDNHEILDVEMPCLTMLVAPGRNLSVLVEAAVRDHLLRRAGIDSSLDFVDIHDQAMQINPEVDS